MLTEGGTPYYYETLLDYVHLNPVRAGIISTTRQESVLDYRWSSLAGGYALPPGKRSSWMACADGLDMFGFSDTVAGRRSMVERLDERAVQEQATRCGVPLTDQEMDARCSNLRRGWYWGTQSFAEQALKLAEKALRKPRSRAYAAAREKRAHDLKEAERLLEEGLGHAGLDRKQLQTLGADLRKVALAVKLRKQTTVSNGWLAENLQMKTAANVSQQIGRFELNRKTNKSLPPTLVTWFKGKGPGPNAG